MAGNVVLNLGTGGVTLGTDRVSGVDYQIVKVSFSTAGTVPTQVDASNGLPVAVIGTVPISGTITTTPPANASTNVTQFGGTNLLTGTGASAAGVPRVTVANDSNILATQSGTWDVTVNTSLPAGGATIGAVTQASGPWTQNLTQVGGSAVTLGAKTSANSIPVVLASDEATLLVSGTVTANAGTGSFTVAQATAANLNATVTGTVTTTPPANASTNVAQFGGTNVSTGTGTGGAGIPRVTVSSDSFPATQAVSGTVTANQGGAPWSENITQFGGVSLSTGTGASGTGIPRVTIANDSNVLATQSGTWTVQPGNTANTTAWKVDGSAVTQPVSGTVTANQGGAPWSANVTQFGGTNLSTGTGAGGAGIPRITVSSDSFPSTQAVTGTFFQATQPVSVVSLPLSTNAAQETGGNIAVTVVSLQALIDIQTKILATLQAMSLQWANISGQNFDASTFLSDQSIN